MNLFGNEAKWGVKEDRKAVDQSFLTQFSNNLRDGINNFGKSVIGTSSSGPEQNRPDSLENSLEQQLQAWRENPSWADPSPSIKVTVPKGSLCNLKVNFTVGLPPDAVYNIVTDPDNKRVFKNIKEVISRKVLVDEGHRQVVELEEAAIWKFLWWSGTFAVCILADQNRQDFTMKFRQIKSGLLKKFEGSWRIEPLFVDKEMCDPLKPKTLEDYNCCTRGKGRVGSKVMLEQLVQPAVVPPPPISWYLRGITSKTVEMILSDLLIEAARIRCSAPSTVETAYDNQVVQRESSCIKQRWALQRRDAKRQQRRLVPAG